VKKAPVFEGFGIESQTDTDRDSPTTASLTTRPQTRSGDLCFGGFAEDDDKYEESALGLTDKDEDASIFAADQHFLPYQSLNESKNDPIERDMTPTPAVPVTNEAATLEESLQSLQTADEDDAFLESLSQPRRTRATEVKQMEAQSPASAVKTSSSLVDDDLFSMGGGVATSVGDAGDDFDFSSYIQKNKGSAKSNGSGLFD